MEDIVVEVEICDSVEVFVEVVFGFFVLEYVYEVFCEEFCLVDCVLGVWYVEIVDIVVG